MGDPKKRRKLYDTPNHPWKKDRIDEEKDLMKEYGLKNHIEIWKVRYLLRRYKERAKQLIFINDERGIKGRQILLSKLMSLGVIDEKTTINDVLNLQLKQFFDRRLQTLLVKKGLARTMKQSRQFITHRHVIVGDKLISSPSYLVSKAEESHIAFNVRSPLIREDHPERVVKKETA
ncbi:MAG: 30S ribosomal protein S4 [Nitrospiraceae bacterium]|nr:30S ribosomal protein S4 [Nitrospiraceae bacterium]